MGRLARWRALLFGYDVFISYRHIDGLGYAMALQNRLRRRDLAVFRDAAEIPAGTPLRQTIKRALLRSRMLVILDTPAARAPESWVPWEAEQFEPTRRPIIEIRLAPGGDPATTLASVERVWVPEEPGAIEPPRPSDAVVTRILDATTFWRRNRLGRVCLAAAVAALGALAVGVGYQTHARGVEEARTQVERRQAEAERCVAFARRRAAAAEQILGQSYSQIPAAVAAAIDAVEADRSIETDRALRRALAVTAPLNASTPLSCSADRVAWSAETLAVAGMGRVCVVDLRRARVPREAKLEADPVALATNGATLAIAARNLGETGLLIIEDAWTGARRCRPLEGTFVAVAAAGQAIVAIGAGDALMVVDEHTCATTTLPLAPSHPFREGEVVLDVGGGIAVVTTSASRWLVTLQPAPRVLVRQDQLNLEPRPGQVVFDTARSAIFLAVRNAVEIRGLVDGALVDSFEANKVDGIDLAHGRLCVHDAGGRVTSHSLPVWELEPVAHPIGGGLVPGMRISRDARDLLTMETDAGSVGSTIRLWDRRTGTEVGRLFHDSYVAAVLPGQGDDAYVTVGKDHVVRFWGDVHRAEIELIEPQSIDAFAVDDRHAIVASGGICAACRRVAMWSARTGELERWARIDAPARAVASHASGVVIATSRAIWTWQPASPESIPTRAVALPFSATAVAIHGESVIAIDGAGRGVRYRLGTWVASEPFSYANPHGGLSPVSAAGIAPRPGHDQIALALGGAIVLAGIGGGEPSAPPILTEYRFPALAFDPRGAWIALAGKVRPEHTFQNPIPTLELQWIGGPRSKIELAPQGDNWAVEVSPAGDRLAVSLGRFLQIRRAPAIGGLADELLQQIEVPWVIEGLHHAGPDTVWVWGKDRARRILLDDRALVAEARRRLGGSFVRKRAPGARP